VSREISEPKKVRKESDRLSQDEDGTPGRDGAADTKPKDDKKESRSARRERQKKEKKIQVKDQGLRRLLINLLKQVLINQQQLREVMSVVLDTITMDSESKTIKDMQAESRAYAKAVREKGSATGPPTGTVFLALLESLAEQDVGQKNKGKLQEIVVGIKDEPIGMDMVRVCRWARAFKEEKKKIILHIVQPEVRQVVLSSLEQLGGTLHSGKAPAGYLEDDLSQWLELLEA